jgi:hypothetical protein
MTRTPFGVANLIVILVAAGCTGGSAPSAPSRPSSRSLPGTLTPNTALRVVVDPVQDANVLALRLSSVDNPEFQGFVLMLLLARRPEGESNGEMQKIGGVTPFPADRPGTFLILIPRRLRQAFSDRAVEPVIVMRLRPVRRGARLSAPLRVGVDSVVARSSSSVWESSAVG